jgi:hypothetical protein
MLRKLIQVFCVLCLLLIVGYGTLSAAPSYQEQLPPAIIAFSGDLESITMTEVEAETTSVTLSWNVANMGRNQLILESYIMNEWIYAVATDQILPAVGSQTVQVMNPINFGPPTYRLSVHGSDGAVLTQRILIVPWDSSNEETPEIVSFVVDAENVDANGLAQQSEYVSVSWEIENRLPMTNLMFGQALVNGSIVSVELSRDNLWIGSVGEGVVAPITPGDEESVLLLLRIVDMTNGLVYDEVQVELAIVGEALAQAPETAPTTAPVNPPAEGDVECSTLVTSGSQLKVETSEINMRDTPGLSGNIVRSIAIGNILTANSDETDCVLASGFIWIPVILPRVTGDFVGWVATEVNRVDTLSLVVMCVAAPCPSQPIHIYLP